MSSIAKTYSVATKYYITPRLYILGDKCFFEKENKREVVVSSKNWHHYWSDYGWIKIDEIWRRRLNKYCNPKPKNNLFGVLDCGSDGDCLFHCIAQGLNQEHDIAEYDAADIRKKTALSITKYNFDSIIETYRLQEEFGEFDGLWEPKNIKSVRAFRTIIETMGNTFWGDHITIQLLEKTLNINIILLKKYTEGMYEPSEIRTGSRIYPLGTELNKNRKTIVLCYEDEVHFTLVGYFCSNYMRNLFDWRDIPKEILEIYNKDCSSEYSR